MKKSPHLFFQICFSFCRNERPTVDNAICKRRGKVFIENRHHRIWQYRRHSKTAIEIASRLVKDTGFDPVLVGPLARAKEFDQGGPYTAR